jgi:hypothetical protein
MENKRQPTRVYASRNSNGDKKKGEYHYSLDDQAYHNHVEEKEFATT